VGCTVASYVLEKVSAKRKHAKYAAQSILAIKQHALELVQTNHEQGLTTLKKTGLITPTKVPSLKKR
jgi:hypothetical protein